MLYCYGDELAENSLKTQVFLSVTLCYFWMFTPQLLECAAFVLVLDNFKRNDNHFKMSEKLS